MTLYNPNDTIIHPRPIHRLTGPINPVVLVSSEQDMNLIRHLCNVLFKKRLMMSHLFKCEFDNSTFTLVGPMIGGPYSAILLEELIASGASQFIFLGWCGAIAPHVFIGDIIIPWMSFIDEGVSKAYLNQPMMPPNASFPDKPFVNQLTTFFQAAQIPFQTGSVWSLDAFYRETIEKIKYFQTIGAIAVEMETASLFTISHFRHVKLVSVLLVSDELFSLKWKPGFSHEAFKACQKKAVESILVFIRDHINE